jgi:hypothetical protein
LEFVGIDREHNATNKFLPEMPPRHSVIRQAPSSLSFSQVPAGIVRQIQAYWAP